MALHLLEKRIPGWVIHYCNGRAVSDPFSVVEDPLNVTCKRCIKKLTRGHSLSAAEAVNEYYKAKEG